ncbi:hypothetical protein RND81_06G174500 [Saponaria officinalis]|uniref:TRF2/HOY1 PH-like domain-containing protein n=1 Tax=Saponaria officinalis TaxID=3572 RepID=A0AAW1KB47_SAPOF
MIQFASSEDRRRTGDKFPVKLEIEDEHVPSSKKQKQFSAHDQSTAGNTLFPAQPSQCNPLDEPSPLGLRLRKSPSLLELIQMRLSQGKSSSLGPSVRDDFKSREKTNTKNIAAAAAATDKLKASNFPASLLRIGSWEYSSRYEGDLVAKCYFAKHKLVWEVLDGGLKSKIEIQWSDIMGLKADLPDDEPATLTVALARQPLFFRETNPQPRKHTLWQATADFTDGQASLHRKHFLQIPNGLLNKHFEKLIQCDVRLNYLSQQPEITLESPYFDLQPSVLDKINQFKSHGFNQRETSNTSTISIFEDIATPSVSQTSSISIKHEDALYGSTEILSRETTSHSSEIDTRAIEASTSTESGKLKNSKSFEQLIIQGIRPSMSMADLVNHIENCMSSENLSFPENESESHKILEDIAQHLLGDFNFTSCSDEISLMSRVNSLCSLIQKDGTPVPSFEVPADEKGTTPSHAAEKTDQSCAKVDTSALESGTKDVSGFKQVPSMPRIDSFGDLLLQLPRIASLPKFLFDISEDGDNQAR